MDSFKCYIYAYIRADGTPYYIGKGTGKRAYNSQGHITKPPKDKSKIIILESNLSTIGAFALERRYIKWWGRKDNDTGILHNRSDGGDGNYGVILTHEQRIKLSNALKGRKQSPKTIAKRSATMKGRPGRKPSPETLIKMSENRKGILHSEETKRKISESVSKSKIGKKLSPEHRQKLREAALKRKLSLQVF